MAYVHNLHLSEVVRTSYLSFITSIYTWFIIISNRFDMVVICDHKKLFFARFRTLRSMEWTLSRMQMNWVIQRYLFCTWNGISRIHKYTIYDLQNGYIWCFLAVDLSIHSEEYSGRSVSGHSQQRPPSLIRPQLFAATTINVFTYPSRQRPPL